MQFFNRNKQSKEMVFTVFAIFIVFIGSSSAQVTDLKRIESIHQIHTLVNAYFRTLANTLNGGLAELDNHPLYADYLAQNEILSITLANMAYNNSLPNHPQLHVPVQPAEQLIIAWTNTAITVFNYRINAITHRLQNEPDSFIRQVVVSSSEQLLWSTQDNRYIIDDHKRQGFPLHGHISRIVDWYTHGDVDRYIQFVEIFGAPIPPPPEAPE